MQENTNDINEIFMVADSFIEAGANSNEFIGNPDIPKRTNLLLILDVIILAVFLILGLILYKVKKGEK